MNFIYYRRYPDLYLYADEAFNTHELYDFLEVKKDEINTDMFFNKLDKEWTQIHYNDAPFNASKYVIFPRLSFLRRFFSYENNSAYDT